MTSDTPADRQPLPAPFDPIVWDSWLGADRPFIGTIWPVIAPRRRLAQLRAHQSLLASVGSRRSIDSLDNECKLLARQHAWPPAQQVLGNDIWAVSVYAPHILTRILQENRPLAARLLRVLTPEQRREQAETQVEMYWREGVAPPASVEELIADWEQRCAEAGTQ